MKLFAFTMDLENEYHGVIDKHEIFKDLNNIEGVLSTLNEYGVKITAFTVGKIFEAYPEVIKLFEKFNCEFEVHSYSHDFNNPDSESEIMEARTAYFKYFNKYPAGYRAPRGKITDSGITYLEKHGFLFDSSIFPSYFPNPFRYLFRNKEIHCYKNSNIIEIPITSVSPFRMTLSVSYIKLLGVNFFMKQSLPEIVCFDSHLHDFIVKEASFYKLPAIWKLIYSRNKNRGTDLCVKFIEHVKQEGYQFCYMSDIYNLHKTCGNIKNQTRIMEKSN